MTEGAGERWVVRSDLLEEVRLVQRYGSVVAVASDSDTHELGKCGSGKFLDT